MISYIRGLFDFERVNFYGQQDNPNIGNIVVSIAISVFSLIAAQQIERKSPGSALVLRCVPIGIGLIWVFNRCLGTDRNRRVNIRIPTPPPPPPPAHNRPYEAAYVQRIPTPPPAPQFYYPKQPPRVINQTHIPLQHQNRFNGNQPPLNPAPLYRPSFPQNDGVQPQLRVNYAHAGFQQQPIPQSQGHVPQNHRPLPNIPVQPNFPPVQRAPAQQNFPPVQRMPMPNQQNFPQVQPAQTNHHSPRMNIAPVDHSFGYRMQSGNNEPILFTAKTNRE